MSNFHYIIASLPELHRDSTFDAETPGRLIDEILSLCKDKNIDFVLKGSDSANLTREFYIEASKSPLKLVRDYFDFDLNVRNEKVKYLNKELGRPADMDVIVLDPDASFEDAPKAEKALAAGDILSREKALDNLYWAKISDLTIFNYFDIEAVIGYILKLKIVQRWAILDPETGREMFRRIVGEVRGTFKGVDAKI
ncbi:MAG: DUF2764 family protein [Bacteroidales bacterium]|nr:DUF2764 family protein [Bacteroidales bacterium]